MNTIKSIYKLSDIKYPWLLVLSVVAFMASLYAERFYDIDPNLEMLLYGFGFAVALIWSILNYMSHLKLNTIYRRYDDIDVFVGNMAMHKDEKSELIEYLNDFVEDLVQQGETQENAVKKAISSFQVQEFSELQGGDVFEKPTHFYLLGYVSIFISVSLMIICINMFLSMPFIILTIALTLAVYGIGFLCLFFLYKQLDVLITKK